MEAATCTAEPADRGNRDCDCDQTIGRRKLFASAVHAHDPCVGAMRDPVGLGAQRRDHHGLHPLGELAYFGETDSSCDPVSPRVHAAMYVGRGIPAVVVIVGERSRSLQAAMPSAVFPIVLARLYDRDTSTALRVILAPDYLASLRFHYGCMLAANGCCLRW